MANLHMLIRLQIIKFPIITFRLLTQNKIQDELRLLAYFNVLSLNKQLPYTI